MASRRTEPTSTNPTLLATGAYDGDQNLSARQHLYDYQEPRFDPARIVSALLADRPVNTIADIGCGNGLYLHRLRQDYPASNVIGLDVAPKLLARLPGPVLQADAMALPFQAYSFDVVLAMHVLFHIPDIPKGLDEIARTLRPDGVLIASTNAADDKQALDDLWSKAAGDVLGIKQGPRRVKLSRRFLLDDAAEIMSSRFSNINIHELVGTITVTSPEPVIAHLASYRSFAQESNTPFDATLHRARKLLQQQITSEGRFQIHCRNGIIVAQPEVGSANNLRARLLARQLLPYLLRGN